MTELYTNDGTGQFTPFNSNLPARSFSQIRFGDYDNDGDADIILTGIDEMATGLPMTQLFRNTLGSNTFGINNPPEYPQNLSVEIDLNNVTFHWSTSSDDKTPSAALTYNIYLGDTPSAGSVIVPQANPETGFHRVYALGNMNQDTSWVIEDLPAGTYYWSVQALDHSLSGSEFSPEQSFEITYIGVNEPESAHGFSVYPNPATDFISLKCEVEGTLVISDLEGNGILTSKISIGVIQIDVHNMANGVYFITILTGEKIIRTKFVILHS